MVHDLVAATHIHPALSGVVQKTAGAVTGAGKGRAGFSHTYK